MKNGSGLTFEVTPNVADSYLSHRNWPYVVCVTITNLAKLQTNVYKCQLCLRVQ